MSPMMTHDECIDELLYRSYCANRGYGMTHAQYEKLFPATNLARFEARYNHEQHDDHDCHAGPESGCTHLSHIPDEACDDDEGTNEHHPMNMFIVHKL